MYKIKFFSGDKIDLENHINEWFKQNLNITVVSHESIANTPNRDRDYQCVSIIYMEPEAPNTIQL
jgi:hypothetical protein